jgi:hypothetical protein
MLVFRLPNSEQIAAHFSGAFRSQMSISNYMIPVRFWI